MLHALKNRFGRRQRNLWRNLLYAMLSASQHGNGYLTHKHVQLKISFIAIPLYMLSIRLIIFKVMNSCVCEKHIKFTFVVPFTLVYLEQRQLLHVMTKNLGEQQMMLLKILELSYYLKDILLKYIYMKLCGDLLYCT